MSKGARQASKQGLSFPSEGVSSDYNYVSRGAQKKHLLSPPRQLFFFLPFRFLPSHQEDPKVIDQPSNPSAIPPSGRIEGDWGLLALHDVNHCFLLILPEKSIRNGFVRIGRRPCRHGELRRGVDWHGRHGQDVRRKAVCCWLEVSLMLRCGICASLPAVQVVSTVFSRLSRCSTDYPLLE